MKLNFYTIGKVKSNSYRELVDYYLDLSVKKNPRLRIQEVIVPDKNSQSLVNPEELLAKYKLNPQETFFLAEWGKQINTAEFIKHLGSVYQENGTFNFVIANAWGWYRGVTNPEIKYLSLSQLVFNHELAYLMLVEQIYRFVDALAGGKYAK